MTPKLNLDNLEISGLTVFEEKPDYKILWKIYLPPGRTIHIVKLNFNDF